MMTIEGAEWLVIAFENSYRNLNVTEEAYLKAKQLLIKHPYEIYECSFCETDYSARVGTRMFKEKLCDKCFLRLGGAK